METRIWFLIIFLPLKESLTLFQIWVFANYQLFCPIWVTKINFIYFNGNCDYCSCPVWWILFLFAPPHKALAFWKNYLWTSLSFSHSLKIICILLRQIISFKKMAVISVKFTILISWSPICNPLILPSALMGLASTLAAILYNSLDSWHHWWKHIGVKGKQGRPFILILDSILVYATSNMWINLSPYPNLCKAEKIKSDQGYYRKIFIQFTWLINYDTNCRKSVYSKVIIVLIASDWCSPIIVNNVFFAFDS